ncbi:MAG: bifunctional nuclease family protein [Candidatus Bathyarchaeota archaeon]|nr:bifunctional nuclease family protein [Candidatus Bathyarchaeota archaeon]
MEESVKVQVSGITQIDTPYGLTPVLLLEDERERVLVIAIGGAEASSIAVAMRGFQSPVPNTHDFMMKVLNEVNVKVKRGEIYDLQSNRFLARLIVESGGGEIKVDGRPSDIIALTVRAGADVYVAEEIMREASIEKSVLLREPEESGRMEREAEEESEEDA